MEALIRYRDSPSEVKSPMQNRRPGAKEGDEKVPSVAEMKKGPGLKPHVFAMICRRAIKALR
jgi:hypothetical protein